MTFTLSIQTLIMDDINSQLAIGNFFMSKTKVWFTRLLALLVASPLLVAGLVQAATSANYTNNGAAATTFGPNGSNILVLDVNVPDAWNGVGLLTADVVAKAGSAAYFQGDALNSFTNPVLGTPGGVAYQNDATAGFQGTEPVIIDLDGDASVTTTADILIDAERVVWRGVIAWRGYGCDFR